MKKEVWLKYRCSSRVTCSQACRAAGKGRPLGTFKRVNQLVQGPLTSAWWLWCWGQRWYLAHPSSAQKCLVTVIYSIKFTLLTGSVKTLSGDTLCFFEICSFLPTFYSSQFSNPWVHLVLSPKCALFMFGVICWDCPFLLLSVPAQFKDYFVLTGFLQWKWIVPPHLSLCLLCFGCSLLCTNSIWPWIYYHYSSFYIDSFPQEIQALEGRGHLSFMFMSLPHTSQHMPEGIREMLKKCTASCTEPNPSSSWVMVIVGRFNPGTCQAVSYVFCFVFCFCYFYIISLSLSFFFPVDTWIILSWAQDHFYLFF